MKSKMMRQQWHFTTKLHIKIKFKIFFIICLRNGESVRMDSSFSCTIKFRTVSWNPRQFIAAIKEQKNVCLSFLFEYHLHTCIKQNILHSRTSVYNINYHYSMISKVPRQGLNTGPGKQNADNCC